MIGSPKSGKTSLLRKCFHDNMPEIHEPTVGLESVGDYSLDVEDWDKTFNLQMWEAGANLAFENIDEKVLSSIHGLFVV